MRSLSALSGVLALAVGLSACGSSGSATPVQLEWCGGNQAKVGRYALENGLMPAGADFTQWKETYPVDYEKACIGAFGEG